MVGSYTAERMFPHGRRPVRSADESRERAKGWGREAALAWGVLRGAHWVGCVAPTREPVTTPGRAETGDLKGRYLPRSATHPQPTT